MQPASSLTKYNVHWLVVIWSPYALIVSQGAIMTSESLRLASLTLAAGRSDGAKRMGLTGPACSRPSRMVIGACFSFPERIYTPALPVVAWWWFSARPRSSSMVVQAARVASGQFSRQGGDHGPTPNNQGLCATHGGRPQS